MSGKSNKKLKSLLNCILISFGISLLFVIFYVLPDEYDFLKIHNFIKNIENSSINLKFQIKSFQGNAIAFSSGITSSIKREGYYKKIHILAIDDDSINFFGKFPWDRKVYADMLNYFNTNKDSSLPELILFDIFFANPSQNLESDQFLFKAFENYKGNVGVQIGFDTFKGFGELKGNKQDIEVIMKKMIVNEGYNYNSILSKSLKNIELKIDKDLNIPQSPKIIGILPEIASNITFTGFANVDLSESVVRKKPLVVKALYYLEENGDIKLTNIYYPDIILHIAVKLLKSDLSNVIISKNKIIIKNAFYNNQYIDFEIPVDNQYRLNINYKAKRESNFLKIISFKDYNRAKYPKDSILLVGMFSAGSAHDIWNSPLGSMFGIEHLAYAIGTVMNRDFIIEIPLWLEILYIIVFTVIIGILISRGIKTMIIGGILSIVFPLLLGIFLFTRNIQFVTMIPLISSILSVIFCEIYMLLTEEKEKKFIKTTFSSYVNPELVDILIQNPEMLQLGGVEKEVTILFSDIRSFTTISEGMTPMDLINFLNIYLTRMTDILMETKGTLDKYIGDAVMGFWGAPIDLPDHALKACQASVKMIESLKEFNEQQVAKGYKAIDIGIGLNSGIVTVGNVGSEKRKNYTVIGDNVNLASRLEGVNKYYHTNIIISEYTYERVKDFVIAREVDLIRVKGKLKPVKIYELIDMKEGYKI